MAGAVRGRARRRALGVAAAPILVWLACVAELPAAGAAPPAPGGGDWTALEDIHEDDALTVKEGPWEGHQRVNALLVSLPRSASTSVGDLLRKISGRFFLFEPYRSCPPAGSRTASGKALPPHPAVVARPIAGLFDCSFLYDRKIAGPVLWEPHAPLSMPVGKNQRGLCKKSWLRVIKTVRFRGYVADGIPYDDPKLRVVHLIRSPASVAISNLKNGWFHGFTLREIVHSTCEEHRVTLQRMSRVPKGQVLRIRMEEVLKKYPPNTPPHHSLFTPFVGMFRFLGIEDRLWNTTSYISSASHLITSGVNAMNRQALTKEDTKKLNDILEDLYLDTCEEVIKELGYEYWPAEVSEADLSLDLRKRFFVPEEL